MVTMVTGKVCSNEFLWDEVVHDLDGHPLQLWGWGELKAAHGWTAHRVLFIDEEDRVVGQHKCSPSAYQNHLNA